MTSVSKTATEALFRDLHGRLFAFLRARVESREDAEDLLQEVFTRIHENAASVTRIENVNGWVYRIARNAVTDYYRRRAVVVRGARALAREGQEEPSVPTASGPEGELADCLTPFVERLPERYREALALTELEELPQREAADRLGLSLSGVKSRVSRGREKLKKLLLDCCHIELDRRRGIAEVEPHRKVSCSCGQASPLVTIVEADGDAPRGSISKRT